MTWCGGEVGHEKSDPHEAWRVGEGGLSGARGDESDGVGALSIITGHCGTRAGTGADGRGTRGDRAMALKGALGEKVEGGREERGKGVRGGPIEMARGGGSRVAADEGSRAGEPNRGVWERARVQGPFLTRNNSCFIELDWGPHKTCGVRFGSTTTRYISPTMSKRNSKKYLDQGGLMVCSSA